MDKFIVGRDIYLRSPDIQKDIIEGNWHEWFNNYEITKYLVHGVYPNTRETQAKLIQDLMQRKDNIILSIIDASNDKLIGTISLKSIDLINRNAEIALVVGENKRPKSTALEAMALMTQHGFERLNLYRIYAGQHISLWKWVNRLELLGYKLEGYCPSTHIRSSATHDSVRMAILASDFYAILEKRKGHYIPENFNAFISKARKDNLCLKLSESINSLYVSSEMFMNATENVYE